MLVFDKLFVISIMEKKIGWGWQTFEADIEDLWITLQSEQKITALLGCMGGQNPNPQISSLKLLMEHYILFLIELDRMS